MGERRWKILWLSQDAVFTLLGGWHGFQFVALPVFQLPTGERCGVVDVCHSWERKCFGIRLYHESFPEVASGDHCPTINPDVVLRIMELRYKDDAGEPLDVPVIVRAE